MNVEKDQIRICIPHLDSVRIRKDWFRRKLCGVSDFELSFFFMIWIETKQIALFVITKKLSAGFCR